MAGATNFCPYCGNRVASIEQRFCGSCGRSLSGAPSAPADGRIEPAASLHVSAEAPPPFGAGPADVDSSTEPAIAHAAGPASGVAAPAVPLGIGPPRDDWATLAALTRLAIRPVLAWAVMTAALGIYFGLIYGDSASGRQLNATLSTVGLGSSGMGMIGLLGTLVAGLGYQVDAGVGAGSLSAGSAGVALSLAPLGSLVILAIAASIATRRSLEGEPVDTDRALLIRVVGGSALAAATIFIVAWALSSFAGKLDIGGTNAFVTPSVSYGGGPRFVGLILVLLPALLIGAVAGTWSRLGATVVARLPLNPLQMSRGVAITASAARGLLAGIVSGSVAVVALGVIQTLARPEQLVNLLKALPPLILVLPNFAVGLAIAASGTPFRVDSGGLGSADGRAYNLYQAPPEVIAVGLVALLLPGVITGLTLRSRRPASTPLEVAGAGVLVIALLLITAAVGLPSLSVASVSAFVEGDQRSAGLSFNLLQAALVGGLVCVATTITAFRLGPAPSLAAPVPAG